LRLRPIDVRRTLVRVVSFYLQDALIVHCKIWMKGGRGTRWARRLSKHLGRQEIALSKSELYHIVTTPVATLKCNIYSLVGFDVFIAVNMKNAVFLDVAPCGFIINRRFGGTCRLRLQGRRNNARATSQKSILHFVTCLPLATYEYVQNCWNVRKLNKARSVI
jgi:hypothetical protein